MPTTLSVDLRQPVASAVSAGATCRQAAERFGVSRACDSHWSQQKRRVGHVAPKPLGGDRRQHNLHSKRIARHHYAPNSDAARESYMHNCVIKRL